MAKELLKIRNLYASYGEEPVLLDISFDIPEGGIFCIVGESGSGKSTLLKAVLGLDRVLVTGGDILYEGRSLPGMPDRERRKLLGREIGLIPQNPAGSFNPTRRLRAQIRETVESQGMAYSEKAAVEAFGAVGLTIPEKVLSSRPYELSGGMNQRIAIAAALLPEPRLLLCDEATSALDVVTAGAVVDELFSLSRSRNTALLMVTHHLGIAKRMSDRIGIMKDGRLIETGSTEEVLARPREEYTRRLLAAVPRLS